MQTRNPFTLRNGAAATKKTIREWEQEFQIFILDLDGFDKSDPHLYDRLFTRGQFESALAECTAIHRTPANNSLVKKATVETAAAKAFKPDMMEATKKRRGQGLRFVRTKGKDEASTDGNPSNDEGKNNKKPFRPRLIFIVLFTLPILFAWVLNLVYGAVRKKVSIPWYIPAALLSVDLIVFFIQPLTPILSGPFFVWYFIGAAIAGVLGPLWFNLNSHILHRTVFVSLHEPFLSRFVLSGTPFNLYFSLGKAITSSLILATMFVFVKDLLTRRKTQKPTEETTRRMRPVHGTKRHS